jgi:hypothetical protein
LDEWVRLLFLERGVLHYFLEEGEGDLAIGLNGVVEGVEQVLGEVGGCEKPHLVRLAGPVELLQESSQAAPSDIAVLVGEAVDRPLQAQQQPCIIFSLHLK